MKLCWEWCLWSRRISSTTWIRMLMSISIGSEGPKVLLRNFSRYVHGCCLLLKPNTSTRTMRLNQFSPWIMGSSCFWYNFKFKPVGPTCLRKAVEIDRQLALQENMEAQQELREPLSPIFGTVLVGCVVVIDWCYWIQRFQLPFPLWFCFTDQLDNDTLGII